MSERTNGDGGHRPNASIPSSPARSGQHDTFDVGDQQGHAGDLRRRRLPLETSDVATSGDYSLGGAIERTEHEGQALNDIDATFQRDLYEGRTVLVSGASRGIGLAIARGFAQCGASVIATSSSEANLARARQDPANAALDFQILDVRREADIRAFAGRLRALHVLVNAQGIVRFQDEFSLEGFCNVLDINLTGVMRLALCLQPQLAATRGSVLNIGSTASHLGAGPAPAYGTSKTGILGLTRALAHAWGGDGIRVNAVLPGWHRTEMTEPFWGSESSSTAIEDRSALKRWGTVDDVVGAALFLASPSAAFITGSELVVDGGYTNGFSLG